MDCERIKAKVFEVVKNMYFWMVLIILVIAALVGYFTPFSDDSNTIAEKIKLGVAVVAPMLTILLFVKTIGTQLEATRASRKSDINQNFYKLLDIFLKNKDNIYKNENIFEIICSLPEFGEEGSAEIFTFTTNLEEADVLKLKFEFKPFENYDYGGEDHQSNLSYILKEINLDLDKYYVALGPYFKSLHRILKLINDGVENREIDENEYFMYRGILTSQLTSDEFLVILYNCLFGERGCGMGVELMESSFFGDSDDLDIDQHFEIDDSLKKPIYDNFIFDESDSTFEKRKNMRKLFKEKRKEKILFMELSKNK